MAKAWWRDSDYELFARLTKERDEARAEVERLREESATQADISSSTIARMKQQLREARAEVERLTDERDELLVRVADQGAELRATRESYNEARAEVDRLKRERDAACMAAGEYSQDEVNAMTTEMIAIRKGYEKNAYRRGAEAMREACAQWVADYCSLGRAAAVRALPIPEEP